MEGHEGCLLCGLVGNEIDTDRGRYKYTSTLCRRRGCRHADRVEDIDTASCYNPITEHHPNRPGSECIGTVARIVSVFPHRSWLRGTPRCDEPVRRAGATSRCGEVHHVSHLPEHGRVTLVSLTVDAAISV